MRHKILQLIPATGWRSVCYFPAEGDLPALTQLNPLVAFALLQEEEDEVTPRGGRYVDGLISDGDGIFVQIEETPEHICYLGPDETIEDRKAEIDHKRKERDEKAAKGRKEPS